MRHRIVASGIATALVACMLTIAAPASGHWLSAGSGVASATSGTLAPPTQVTAELSGPASATISWAASSGGIPPEGYYVERIGVDATQPACGTSRASLQSVTECVDSGLSAGVYTYRVTAVYRSWTAPSASSSSVTVATLLGAAESFSVLGNAVTSTGFTRVSGDLGVHPGVSVVGFPDGIVDGYIHAGDAMAAAAQSALVVAYADLAGRSADALIAGDLGGSDLGPAVYHAGGALGLTGILTLDGGGDPNAVFVFQVDAAVTTAAASSVVLLNGATAANVYWVVDGAVGTGALAGFAGNILAQGAITLGAGGQLIGRALSRVAVSMGDNVVRFTTEPAPLLSITGGATATTKDVTPAIAGTTTALPGRVVTVTVGGQVLMTPVQSDGSWSVTAPELLASTYSVVAKLKDAAGNGATATQNLVVEVSPPTVELAQAAPFSILAGTTITATGTSHVDGDVGLSPGTSVVGLPPDAVGGAIHAGDLTAAVAISALSEAIDDASARLPHTHFTGDLIGSVFQTGVHHTSAALALTGTMTLDAEGDPNAIFIFQVDAAMNTAAGTSVLLINGARASNVFWVVDAAVGTGASASLPGTILATGAITLGEGTHLTGRALTLDGVVMHGSTISQPPL